MTPKIIVIDGLIGVGKSSVLAHLKKLGFVVFEEPIALWTKMLEQKQENPTRWAFTFQVQVLSHFIELEKKIKKLNESVVFVERCAFNGLIFTQLSYEKGELTESEFNILNKMFWNLDFKIDQLFFLEAPINICFTRIRERGRKCEENLTVKYLTDLSRHYNNALQTREKHIINSSRQIADIVAEILSIVMKN